MAYWLLKNVFHLTLQKFCSSYAVGVVTNVNKFGDRRSE